METITLQWDFDDGLQTYRNGDPLLDDWMSLPVMCPRCRAEWQVVTAVNAMGAECPHCHNVDPFLVWAIPHAITDLRTSVQ